jgi:selenide,water dikinase
MEISKDLRLTQTVQKGGCAAKVAATELRKILGKVQFPPQDPNVLVDGGLFDDAAIYKIHDDLALVQTLDFFTPIVDSPKLFGRVAAANALSDVYAMGGIPKTAMAIFAFPLSQLDNQVAVDILQGASDIMAEAKVNFVGGHSIDDDTIKFGLSVTGFVHPQKVWTNAAAKVGDVLILTKPLGTGTLSAALKRGEIQEEQMHEALKSMMLINSVPEILSAELKSFIHAATDITGFGLLGHSLQMAQASQVSLQIRVSDLPFFSQAPHFLEKGFLTKAHKSNTQYADGKVTWPDLSEIQKLLLADPQTSGGLLLSVAAEKADAVLSALQNKFLNAKIVGAVKPKTEHHLSFSR